MTDTDMNAALLPCPFCGAELEKSEVFSNRTATTFVHPGPDSCIACGTIIEVSDREENRERVAAWNRRASSEAPSGAAEPDWGPAVRAATRKSHASIYATPAQAVAPTEGIGELVERLMARANTRIPEINPLGMTSDDFLEGQAATALTSLSARLAEAEREKDGALFSVKLLRTRATASEAEASDLRRKLEEAREALEEVRGHFRVEYPKSDGGKPAIGYDSEALPKVIAILDNSLTSGGQDER
ncbi:MAG: hypothetical protein E5W82_10660 [Mesorhizobium sp.]|nr:MAG: hypothetical protein E5W82_10660 [Mesorhizobium sp.]